MLLASVIINLTLIVQSSSVGSIRDVDFMNFTYPKLPTGKCSMNKVRVKDGKYGSTANFKPRTTPRGGCWEVSVGPVQYGDVTGDGQEEAIVVIYAEVGGTESANDVFVYSLGRGHPVLLWKFATGDRAEGGLIKLYAEGGHLAVELAGKNKFIGSNFYADDGTASGLCCPTMMTRSMYYWIRGAFRRRGQLAILAFKGWNGL
jgi:hypothetical protein